MRFGKAELRVWGAAMPVCRQVLAGRDLGVTPGPDTAVCLPAPPGLWVLVLTFLRLFPKTLERSSFCEQTPDQCPVCLSPATTERPRPQLRLLVSFPPVLFRREDTEAALPLYPGRRAGASLAPQHFLVPPLPAMASWSPASPPPVFPMPFLCLGPLSQDL